ncbi:MAG TPA: hypothetical protein VHB48_17155 [Chitinophagaceae bacterium]|nr:hypothetical protein [Chitinophagaceae bacterium]
MAKYNAALGLSIGTRKVGSALMTNNHLDCARVWVFPGRWSEPKLQKMMRRLDRKMKKYHITSIAIKVPSPTHHTSGLRQLIAAIKVYCAQNSVYLHICTIHELKPSVSKGRSNKKMLIQQLAAKYPRLYLKAQKELMNRNAHHIKMFEAVAAAELLQKILTKNT